MIRLALFFVVVFGMTACGGGGGSGGGSSSVADKVIASVSMADGNDQIATVGTSLPNPLVALVQNQAGQPLPGQVVNFVVTAGGGSVFAAAVTSDSNGFAREVWTLGTAAGAQKVEVRAVDSNGSPVVYATFTATAVAGASQTIGISSGNNQSGQQIQPLPSPVAVIIKDANGNPVANVSVAFSVSNGGNVSPGLATTDANGVASAIWTLGPTLGVQTLSVTGSGLSPVSFQAYATPAPVGQAATIKMVAGDQQAVQQHSLLALSMYGGSSLNPPKQPFTVLVTDALGNPVPGVRVNFAAAGSGSINPKSVHLQNDYSPYLEARETITDTGGIASWSGFFHAAGEQKVEASVAGIAGIATFTVNVTPFGHPYDGLYFCAVPPGSGSIQFTFANGSAGYYADHTTVTASVDETTGTFNAERNASGWNIYKLSGILTIDSLQQVSGTGPYVYSTYDPLGPLSSTNGTWSCNRQ